MPSRAENRLREMRLEAWTEAKALADLAAGENRALTANERAIWTALNDRLDVLDRRLKIILDLGRRTGGRLSPPPVNPDHPWKAKINFARKDPPPQLPAGCWDLVTF